MRLITAPPEPHAKRVPGALLTIALWIAGKVKRSSGTLGTLDSVLGGLLLVPRPKGQERVISRGSQGADHWGCELTVPPVGRQVDRSRLAVDAARAVILINGVGPLRSSTDRTAIAVSHGSSW